MRNESLTSDEALALLTSEAMAQALGVRFTSREKTLSWLSEAPLMNLKVEGRQVSDNNYLYDLSSRKEGTDGKAEGQLYIDIDGESFCVSYTLGLDAYKEMACQKVELAVHYVLGTVARNPSLEEELEFLNLALPNAQGSHSERMAALELIACPEIGDLNTPPYYYMKKFKLDNHPMEVVYTIKKRKVLNTSIQFHEKKMLTKVMIIGNN